MLSETAKTIAKLLDLELEELAKKTTSNFAQLFKLNLSLEA
jgi:Tat protein secretion system quality control protein TatD with DNase activity